MKPWRYLVPLAAFVIAGTAMIPLRMAWAASAPESNLSVATIDGTVWSGKITGVTWRGLSLGDFSISISPLDLLPQPAMRLTRGTGPLKSALLRTGHDTLEVSEADIRVDLAKFGPHLPRGVIARVGGVAIHLRAGACFSASGRIEVPAAPSANLPAFNGTLACEHGALVAQLASNLGKVELVAAGPDFARVGWRNASPALAIALIAAGVPQEEDA